MNKQKLLKALNCSLDDISEDRLIDILVDAYKAKKDRIQELEQENQSEREKLYHDQQNIRDELKRMRCDPLYGASGEYHFECNGKLFCIIVQGSVEMYERNKGIDYVARHLGMREWSAASAR